MKTYVYDFMGVYLGGFMYVRGKDRKEADRMFKKTLPDYLYKKNINSNGRLNDCVTTIEIKNGKCAQMIWNGDY
jgi:hypothetical protein